MFLTFVVQFSKRKLVLIIILIIIGLILFNYLFYRDPERIIPVEEGLIISPADGQVISIDLMKVEEIPVTVKNGKSIYFPELKGVVEGNYTVISIFMNPLDVHVNRSPIPGEVKDTIYIEGKHSPAFGEVLSENERNIIVIDGEIKVVTVQIAGTVARRIDCFVIEGQNINAGDKIGRIKLGSQVVLMYQSKSVTIAEVGDRVKAGESVIAKV